MSEYIIEWSGIGQQLADLSIVEPQIMWPKRIREERLREPIVRCRDCKHYYEAENYHPSGNYVMRCCKYFDTYNDEVEPDGFCAWGERRDA